MPKPPVKVTGDDNEATLEDAEAKASTPMVNWNAGRSGGIRTSLRGSRRPSASQHKPSTAVSVKVTPHVKASDYSAPASERPQAASLPLQASLLPPTPSQHITPAAATLQILQLGDPRMDGVQALDLAAVKEGRCLIIEDIGHRAILTDLDEYFKGFNIVARQISCDPLDGRSSTIGFLELPDTAEAQRALRTFSYNSFTSWDPAYQTASTSREAASSQLVPSNPNGKTGGLLMVSCNTPLAHLTRPKNEAVPGVDSNTCAESQRDSDAVADSKTKGSMQTPRGLLVQEAITGLRPSELTEIIASGSQMERISTSAHGAASEAKQVGREENAKGNVGEKPSSLSMKEDDARHTAHQSEIARRRSSAVSPTSMEDGSDVMLNLVDYGQGSEIEVIPAVQMASQASDSSVTSTKPTIPLKRTVDAIDQAKDADSSEERETGSDGHFEEDGLSSSEEAEEEVEEGEISDSSEDDSQSEEGEIPDDPSDAVDNMLVDHTNGDQQPRIPRGLASTDMVDVSSSSSREPSPVPDTRQGDGPRTLRELSAADLRIQIRYFYVGRDPQTIPESDVVHCTICAKEGHVKRHCPAATCSTCGDFKKHFTHACPRNQRCSRCRGQHSFSACPLKLKPDNLKLICDLCQEDGHAEDDCELRWRSSGALWKKPLPPLSIARFCYECGKPGHLGNDCLQRQPGKAMGSSMWSAAGLPYPMQSIKTPENLLPPSASRSAMGPLHHQRGQLKGKGKQHQPLQKKLKSDAYNAPLRSIQGLVDLDATEASGPRGKQVFEKAPMGKHFKPSPNIRIASLASKKDVSSNNYPYPDTRSDRYAPQPRDLREAAPSRRDGNYHTSNNDSARRQRSRSRSPARNRGPQNYRPRERDADYMRIRGRAGGR